MSDTYTKLFSGITASTIVSESLATRWLWVTLLAAVKPDGCVYASVPGLARLANITLDECEQGLLRLGAADTYSRTQDHDGRRIAPIDGGWHLLNHAKYDKVRNPAERAEYKRNWDRANRSSGYARQSDDSPPIHDGPTSSASASASASEKQKAKPLERQAARFDEFWAIYPNAKGKKEALAKWKARDLDRIADLIIADVRERKVSDRDWLRGYVPHGSTYVNGAGWEDAIVCGTHGTSAANDAFAVAE